MSHSACLLLPGCLTQLRSRMKILSWKFSQAKLHVPILLCNKIKFPHACRTAVCPENSWQLYVFEACKACSNRDPIKHGKISRVTATVVWVAFLQVAWEDWCLLSWFLQQVLQKNVVIHEGDMEFAPQALKMSEVPAKCTPETMRAVFKQHLQSPSMWAIFPLQVFTSPTHPWYTSMFRPFELYYSVFDLMIDMGWHTRQSN